MDEGTKAVVTKVVDMLDGLANQLGVAKEVIFPWYVKQQLIEAYAILGMIGISFVAGLFLIPIGWIIGMKYNKKYKDENDGKTSDFTRWDFILCLGAVCLLGSIIAAFGNGSSVVSQIFNPEYNALRDLFSQLIN